MKFVINIFYFTARKVTNNKQQIYNKMGNSLNIENFSSQNGQYFDLSERLQDRGMTRAGVNFPVPRLELELRLWEE